MGAMAGNSAAGWQFRNESDCFQFLDNSGLITSYRAEGGGGGGGCCPPVWDGFLCWPAAPLTSVVEQPCPANIPQLNPHSKQPAVRYFI